MYRKIILTLFLIFTIINLTSQSLYFGKNRFGRMAIINDSICVLSFYNFGFNTEPYNDTCNYIIKNDTMFISTKMKDRYEILSIDTTIPIFKSENVITRVYRKSGDYYNLQKEFVIAYDKVNRQVILNNDEYNIKKGDLILFVDKGRILLTDKYCNKINSQYIAIKFNRFLYDTSQKMGMPYYFSIFLNDFPLIIKGNKIFPAFETDNEQCWAENGFYFPVMKKSKNEKPYYVMSFIHFSKDLPVIKCFNGSTKLFKNRIHER